ncbi:hypothetical protein OL548_00620 [Lysinibacillus sp. MHQ-1]|nr:hypothetical protein OL548_00620 [Lysinibacillus sp. MHQ-1]
MLLLIAVITTQSIKELNNRMTVDLEQELTSVGLLTAMNLDSDEVKDLLSEKRRNKREIYEGTKATRFDSRTTRYYELELYLGCAG